MQQGSYGGPRINFKPLNKHFFSLFKLQRLIENPPCGSQSVRKSTEKPSERGYGPQYPREKEGVCGVDY